MNKILPVILTSMTGFVFSICTATMFLLQIQSGNGKKLPGKVTIKNLYLLILIPLPFLLFSIAVCLEAWGKEISPTPWVLLPILLVLIAVSAILFYLYDRKYLLPLSQKNSVPYEGLRSAFLALCTIISAMTMTLLGLCMYIIISREMV